MYKFYYTDDNKTKQIYVFSGTKPTDDGSENVERTKLFAADPNNSEFDDIFSTEERKEIDESKDMKVIFINQQIHLDDTVETIKKKLMVSMTPKRSFGELYLFAKQSKILDPVSVYQKLTQNGKLDLTKDQLDQFLLNIDDKNAIKYDKKDTYNYDDIIALNLDKKTWLVSKPIGQKFIAGGTILPYTINPFNVQVYDPTLERFAEKITIETNSNLLMNTGQIDDKKIFVCEAIKNTGSCVG